jgi:aldehyde dehydrogenase (NAD+)
MSASVIINKQRDFFKTNITKDINFRREQLGKLKNTLIKYETRILNALKEDLNKPEFESYGEAFYILLEEIKHNLKNIKKWAKNKKIKSPMLVFSSKSYIHYEPYGISLVIGSWNVPFTVTLLPLIGIITAGNCAVLKPSEIAANSSCVMKEMIKETFDDKYITVVEGGVRETTELLGQRFDLIVYTGGTETGKIIAKAAAENLTPVVLELGGKNPCIVNKDADMKTAAKRIVWAKCLNSGQICTSPDYLLVHRDIKAEFTEILRNTLINFYGNDPLNNPDLSRIVNERHFERLCNLLNGDIIFGGNVDKNNLCISPALIDNVSWNDEIMKNEIFGPLLPIIEFENLDSVIKEINNREKPLALYIYTKNKNIAKKIIESTSSGGVGINVSIQHFLNRYLPFGGIGNSGIGNYRGEFGFKTFSHEKSVLDKSTKFEMDMMYAPYTEKKSRMLKRLLKTVM